MNTSIPNIIDQIRDKLKPDGQANIVRLHLDNPFFDADFIVECVEELEKMTILSELGELPSNLERLAYILLCDSAFS